MATSGETITIVIAVVGCGLSIISCCLSIYNTVQARIDKRPKIKLLVEIGFMPTLTDERLVMFKTMNAGSSTVQIVSLYVLMPDKTVLVFPQMGAIRPLPQTIEPNRSDVLWLEYKNIYGELVNRGLGNTPKLIAQVADALGTRYKGKPLVLEPPDSFKKKTT